MSRLSINELTTFRWTLAEDLRHYASAGIPAIGLWRRKIADLGDDAARQNIRQSGLAISSLMWAGGFTSHDGVPFKDALADAGEALDFASGVGAPILVVHSGGRGGHTLNHARRIFQNALKELLPRAEAAGVTLAIEPMHPHYAAEWTVYAGWQEALDLVVGQNSPRLRLVLDMYHYSLLPERLDLLSDIVPWLALVQLADGKQTPEHEQDRCRLGDGRVPLVELFDQLRELGYAGDFDVELFGPEIERCHYGELLSHCKAVFARLSGGDVN
ncbi:MAG: sugar phosphate isomerase/epimerase family protein [Pirellulales bacterium]|nr:sugar phosphate isomerase/epimerase family protein [Pirellulales bacterium]